MSDGTVVAIKVHFTLLTKDRLRKVVFGLEKDVEDTTVTWKINFQLFERTDPKADFGDPIVNVDIEVDKALNPKAEKTAKGMTLPQQAHALGPAANDQKKAKKGQIPQPKADRTTQDTLKK